MWRFVLHATGGWQTGRDATKFSQWTAASTVFREHLQEACPRDSFYWHSVLDECCDEIKDNREPRHRFCSVACYRKTLDDVKLVSGVNGSVLESTEFTPSASFTQALDRNALVAKMQQRYDKEFASNSWSLCDINLVRQLAVRMLNVDTGLLLAASTIESCAISPGQRRRLPGTKRWREHANDAKIQRIVKRIAVLHRQTPSALLKRVA